MPAAHDTYTRRQGMKKTYHVEYTDLRYQISLDGKVLKKTRLSPQMSAAKAGDACWSSAVADIEHLRGMPEQ